MTSVKIVCRPSTKKGRQQGSLSFRLIHKRRIKTVTIPGCIIFQNEWDEKKQSIIYPESFPNRILYLKEIQTLLESELGLIKNYISSLKKKGYYQVEDIVSFYKETKCEATLQAFTKRMAIKLEKQGKNRTARAYITAVSGIIAFNRGKDIPLNQINDVLIKEFELHLQSKGLLPNSISFYMRNLRAIYNKAIENQRIVRYLGENPFLNVFTGVNKTMKRALTAEEVYSLINYDFDTLLKNMPLKSKEYEKLKKIQNAQLYFAFCFQARGMCFVDLAHLRKSNIRDGFIKYVRAKTQQQIELKLTPEMIKIIEHFADETSDSPYLFPIITDENKHSLQYESGMRLQNSKLKELAQLTSIPKQISTHWARHSWATIAKYNNVHVRVISECLGHTSEKTTQIYLDSLNNAVLDDANEKVISSVLYPAANGTIALRS